MIKITFGKSNFENLSKNNASLMATQRYLTFLGVGMAVGFFTSLVERIVVYFVKAEQIK